MAEEKSAQEQYSVARSRLLDVGQHGIAWAFDLAWAKLRFEHRAETQAALDARKPALNHGEALEALRLQEEAQLHEDAQLHDEPVAPVPPFEPIDVPVIITPQAGAAGEGGGASSAAGSDDKSPLPGGVIA